MSTPLVQLFEAFDREATAEFVRSQIGALLDFDAAHSTDLAGELERTLDAHHRRALDPGVHASHVSLGAYRSAQAARALELIETDLAEPNERVAVHLALKLAQAFDLSASSR
jgi:DNA-binding PucR family transcriptional regulator